MHKLACVLLLALVGCAVAPAPPLRGGARATPGTPQPTGSERAPNGEVITRNHYEDVYLGNTSERLPEDNTYRGPRTTPAPQVESEFDRQQRNLRDAELRWQASQKREAEQAAAAAAAAKAKADADFAAAAPQRAAAAEAAKVAERARLKKARGFGPKQCGSNMRCMSAAFCAQYKGQAVAPQEGPDYEKCLGKLVCCANLNWNEAMAAKGKKIKPQLPQAQAPAKKKSNGPRDCLFGGGKCVAANFCSQNKGQFRAGPSQAGCKGKLVCCMLPANAFQQASAAKKAKAGAGKPGKKF